MTKVQAERLMSLLIGYFDRLETAKTMVSELEFDVRYDGLEQYADKLWKIERSLEGIINQMGSDILVAQVRIDRRMKQQG